MLSISGTPQRFCDGLSRRTFMRIGALGLGGLSLPQLLHAADPTGRGRRTGSQKSVIMVYLPGGPPNIDMFDLKPDAPGEIRGSFSPMGTNVSGIRICSHLPKMARLMDKMVVIRSLVGTENRHESFQCYSGRSGGRPGDNEPAGGWPTFGSVVSELQGPGMGGVPPSVDAGPKMGYMPYNNLGWHDAAGVRSWPGFLGRKHVPFHLDGRGKEDLVLNGITGDRLGDRRQLLRSFDEFRRSVDSSGEIIDALDPYRKQAFNILTSSRLAEAMDLSREDPLVRERYGEGTSTESSFGGAPNDPQKLLLARRLVEAGARVVNVAFGAWDWHGNRGGSVEKLGKENFPVFDHAFSTFIQDLDERGMLEDVTVVAWGEFGRTPRINAKGGRDHWTKTSCALLAGGGMRTGQVIGETDAHGGEPVSRPVHIQEVFSTLYHNLGIDVEQATVNDLNGRPRYLVDENRKAIRELI
jgi:hypothetical protein